MAQPWLNVCVKHVNSNTLHNVETHSLTPGDTVESLRGFFGFYT